MSKTFEIKSNPAFLTSMHILVLIAAFCFVTKDLYFSLQNSLMGIILLLIVVFAAIEIGEWATKLIFVIKIDENNNFSFSSYYKYYKFSTKGYDFNIKDIESYKTTHSRSGNTFIINLKYDGKIKITKQANIFEKDDYALFINEFTRLVNDYNKNRAGEIIDKEIYFYKSTISKIIVYSQILLSALLIITAIILSLNEQSRDLARTLIIFGGILGFAGIFQFLKRFIINNK